MRILLKEYMFFVILVFMFDTSNAQKKLIQEPQDFENWEEIFTSRISSDGEWATYFTKLNGKFTLHLEHLNTGKSFEFQNSKTNNFAGSNFFGVQQEDAFTLVDLRTTSKLTYSRSEKTEFSPDYKYVAIKGTTYFIIRDLETGLEIKKENVVDFAWNKNHSLAIIRSFDNQKTVEILSSDFRKSRRLVSKKGDVNIFGLTWGKSGKSIAFFVTEASHDSPLNAEIYFYNGQKLFSLGNPSVLKNRNIVLRNIGFKLLISPEDLAVFFKTQRYSDQEKQDLEKVEVWNSFDEVIFPEYQKRQLWKPSKILTVWFPDQDSIGFLTDQEFPEGVLTSSGRYVLSYSNVDYLPLHENVERYNDVFITDLKTGERKQLLKKQPVQNKFQVSPSGRYISYFKEGHWWLYDTRKNNHIKISDQIVEPLKNEGYNYSGVKPPYGNGGWSSDEKFFLVYDQFDIWAISTSTLKPEKLTRGREDDVIFRVHLFPDYHYNQKLFYEYDGESYDLNRLILEGKKESTKETGFFKLDAQNKIIDTLVWGASLYKDLRYAKGAEKFIVKKENFDLSPQILAGSWPAGFKLVKQSNPQKNKYFWGKSKLLSYKGLKGENLQASLFFPANYDPSKSYPLIVNIYEKLSWNLNRFVSPSLFTTDGFNTTNFTQNGYFVLQPDIIFENKQTGYSAQVSVEKAIDEAIQEANIDLQNIGLIGHSYGGYLSLYLSAHSTRFKTVISGAGKGNLLKSYFRVNWKTGVPEFWRAETFQGRFEDSFFAVPMAYMENSPILSSHQIVIPILLWSGKEDFNVHWEQSVDMYMALRLQNKKANLLLYPNEQHVMSKKSSQLDLTTKVKDWFDYYLKGREPNPNWINSKIRINKK